MTNQRLRSISPVFPKEAIGNEATRDRSLAAAPGAARKASVIRHARDLVTIEVARDEDPRRIAQYLETLGEEIVYAYLPSPRRTLAKRAKRTDDRPASRQWAHSAVRLDTARARAGFADASNITVAVADSGIDVAHPALKNAIVEYRNFVKGEDASDYLGHGTHVAGIIAGRTNKGVGIAGLCAAKILALKVLATRADWDAPGYYRALGYCIGRAQVLNLSLGEETLDPGGRDVINDLLDAGIIVVAAMGNDYGKGNSTKYPAALAGVCAVGATDQADHRGEFSNTGRHIALCAPGVGIVSTTPTYQYPYGASGYDAFDGTSMATAHVSAAAALVLAAHPEMTSTRVIQRLQQSADRVPFMDRRPSTAFGWGRLNIAAALVSCHRSK